jgi:hypothetical protein
MRIDVQLAADAVDNELARLQEKFSGPGRPLHGLPALPSSLPGLALRYREADGEFYLYVEDTALGRMAGYTVFARVADLGRPAGRFLRAPHSRYASAYQRRGIATAVYQWALNAGLCLVSGPRQSPAAHALWRSLAAHYALGCVRLQDKTLSYLGPASGDAVPEDLDTRMVLLGAGWDWDRLLSSTGGATSSPAARRRNSAARASSTVVMGAVIDSSTMSDQARSDSAPSCAEKWTTVASVAVQLPAV